MHENEQPNEQQVLETKISPDFLFVKILGHPEMAKTYRNEIIAAGSKDPGFVVRCGKEWSDAAFHEVADEFAEILSKNPQSFQAARRDWKPDRFAVVTRYIDARTGNLSIASGKGGELSLTSEGGELSLSDKR